MRLRPVDPDDQDAVAVAADLANAVSAVDAPWAHPVTAYRMAMEVRHSWDGDPGRWWLGYDGSLPVALLSLERSRWDNHHLAWLEVQVRPEHRRRGHGSEALRLLEERAIGEGVTTLGSYLWERSAGEPFAARHGYVAGSVEVLRRIWLPASGDGRALDRGRMTALHDAARAAGAAYEVEVVVGRTDEERLEELAEVTAAINDAPTDDLEIEDEQHPVERVRDYESAQLDGGHRLHRVLVRHRATGALAGHSVVVVDVERPAIGRQHDTTVLPAHRGHRLGLLLKTSMLRHLAEAEPQLGTVDTANAASNAHMIAVNEALGHEQMGREVLVQRRVRSGP